MNDLLGEYLDIFVLIFLDDILVYFQSVEEHAEHLRKVLHRLREYRLYTKASKYQILKTSLEFLGHEVTVNEMAPTEQNLKAVREWERPRDVTSLRAFLGFANYYRRYMQGYAHLENSLTELTKKGVPFQWGPYQRRAFAQLKDALCTAPILQYPDPSLPYVVVTDAP